MLAPLSANVKRNLRREVAQMETRLVTLGRAAEELQVSRDTLRRLAGTNSSANTKKNSKPEGDKLPRVSPSP
jgi:orotate phosphoribosyltransferase-like protein